MSQDIKTIIDEYIHDIVGDTPVPNQINNAINNHIHKECVTREEYDALKKQVDMISDLVGDTSVASQIAQSKEVR